MDTYNNYVFVIKDIKGQAITRDAHLNMYKAVKKQPFSILISTTLPHVDFNTAKLTATLRYYTDNLPGKDVAFVKANPLEYTSNVVETEIFNETETQAASEKNNFYKSSELEVSAKILTLSSQHQGAHFYIHFHVKMMDAGQVIYCELDTPAIQVISKKGQNHIPIQRRKPAGDLISAALNRIEQSENEKTGWLQQLCNNDNTPQEPVWQSNPTTAPDASSRFSRLCYSFRNAAVEERAIMIANELSLLSVFEKNMLEYIVTNMAMQ